MIYDDLVRQYENLDENDKNTLLVYKSRLSKAINFLDNNDEVHEIYEYYQRLLNNPENMFIAFTVFNNISFESYDSFKKSLISIKSRLSDVTSKLVLPRDTTVYRVVSVKEGDKLDFLARTELISTSMNLDECGKFLIPNKGYTHYLYQINLDKNSPVAVCPYGILLDSNHNRLILSKDSDQEEVILSKKYYDFDVTLETVAKLDNDCDLNIVSVDAKAKQKVNSSGYKK